MTADDEIACELRAAQDALDVAQDALTDAARTREAAILSARAQGMPAARIADLLGTDRQIVYRILKRA